MEHPKNEWTGLSEAERLTGYSASRLRDLARKGKIQSKPAGNGRMLYHVPSIIAYAEGK